MQAVINRDGCISCGVCESVCPEVFRIADDGLAEVYVDGIPSGAESTALDAQSNCPVSVISVE